MMVEGFDDNLRERLKQAEIAEREVQRLQPLAAEAPQLRMAKIKAERETQRRQAREESTARAQECIQAATERQIAVPDLLGSAARAVIDLYSVLKDVDAHRRKAMEALAVADRVDYDIELEEGEAHERSLDRDPRGLAYALAARHGEARIRQMLEDLDPGFSLLRGCNLDDPLYRDVANFVVRHAVPKEAAPKGLITPPAQNGGAVPTIAPPEPEPKQRPKPQPDPRSEPQSEPQAEMDALDPIAAPD